MTTTRTTLNTREPSKDPSSRRWTREEYYKMADLGLFRGQRAELIDGEIMVLPPQGPSHSYCTYRAYTAILGSGWPGIWVRMQLPIDFGTFSEPEPDVSVVPGTAGDYKTSHPTTALLIVEISDSTLRYDQGRKASFYASLGVADYWIVNVIEGHLEVRRNPRPDSSQFHGWGYEVVTILQDEEFVSPLMTPAVRIAVLELLP